MSALQTFRQWAAGSTAFHVAFGFVLMGGWAMFANRNHPLPDALLAGLVQGAISGTLTLFLKKFLEWMSANMDCRRPRRQTPAPAGDGAGGPHWFQLIVPPLITAATIFAILFTAHTLARTPEVAATSSFPFLVSTTYAILYNLRLWRAAHER